MKSGFEQMIDDAHDALEKVYKGVRSSWTQTEVTVNGERLKVRADLYAQDRFDWGHYGSQAAQLALSILADYLGDDEQAFYVHREFKKLVIAPIRSETWTITGDDIDKALEHIPRPVDYDLPF